MYRCLLTLDTVFLHQGNLGEGKGATAGESLSDTAENNSDGPKKSQLIAFILMQS